MTVDDMVGRSAGEVEPRDRRAERYGARYLLWKESALPRVQGCGRASMLPGGLVAVKAQGAGLERRAGYGGLTSCGSVWCCPVCAAKIAGERQDEIASAVREWQARGHTVAMVTLTNRHRRGQSLRSLWDGNTKAWHAVTSGGSWRREQGRYDVQGWCRVVEVTVGANGWHVHVHALLFLRGDCRVDPRGLGAQMFGRWADALDKAGLAAPLMHLGGLDVRVLGGDVSVLGAYFAKAVYRGSADDGEAARLAMEIARGDLKDARLGNRTPFRVLRDIELHGDADDLATWHEWERTSKGRRQLTWSKGLRADLLAGVVERTDEEVADADDVRGEPVLYVKANAWRWAAWEGAALLVVAESDDTGNNLRAVLRARGWGWLEPSAVLDAAAAEVAQRGPGGRFLVA